MRNKRILIYGFKPFLSYTYNITEQVIRKLPEISGLVLSKKIFDVKFNQKMFASAINEFSPEVIIGTGMAPRGQKIRIENKGFNLCRRSNNTPPKKILQNRPGFLFTNLKIKPSEFARLSYNAGDYVCNFSMFVCLNYALSNNIKYTFLHIPFNYGAIKATNFIVNILRMIKNEKL